MIRLKNGADLAMARVRGVEMRVSLRKGSRRFSKELALEWMKQDVRASKEEERRSCSSIRAVSSCNLYGHTRAISKGGRDKRERCYSPRQNRL